jgi:glycosyltransferase involved in cell wall biosynthesis
LRLPVLLSRRKYDIFLTPDAILPFLNFRVPMVAIVNDTIPFSIPEYFKGTKKVRLLYLFRFISWLAVLRCRRILVISEHSRRDVIRHFSCPPGKIDLTYLGGPELYPPAEVSGLDISHRNYLLYVGRREYYKGIQYLLHAFESLKRETRSTVKLVLVGEPDPRFEAYYESIISGMEHRADVINTGYVNDDELSWLYIHALALVHPSLYEGFGLPPLYAMSYGTPVVCSNRASLPEVVGDAALIIDPEDGPGFVEALKRIVSDAGLRDDLVARGKIQAAKFDWKYTAANVVASLRRALDRNRADVESDARTDGG